MKIIEQTKYYIELTRFSVYNGRTGFLVKDRQGELVYEHFKC